ALTGGPRRAVGRGAPIIVVPAILHPLRGIPGGVEKAERVGLEGADRKSLRGLAGGAFAAVGLALADLAPPPVWGRSPSASGILPLRLRRQAIDLVGLLGQPGGKLLGVKPAEIDGRTLAASPVPIVAPMLAPALVHALVPFVESDLVA